MADEWKSKQTTSDADEINAANTDDKTNNASTSASWQTSSQTASANEWPSTSSASDSMSDNRWNSSGAGNMDSETGDRSNISGDLTPETASDMASAGGSAYSGSAMTSSNGDGTSPSLKEQAAQKGQELLEKGKETAGQALDRAKSQVKSQLSEQKDRATDTLASATEALQGTSQHFRDQNLGVVADYAESFASQVRKVSDYLREKDLDEVGRDVETFARQNPAVFIGGAFLLGVAVARFLRSSESGSPMDAFTNRNTALMPAGPSALTTGVNANEDAFGQRPLTAHDYVPGYGVKSSSPPASA